MSEVEIASLLGNEIQQDKCGEIQEDAVVISINRMIEKLPPVSADHCIYRVHEALRRLKPQAYTPQVVSIGPLHHGSPWLEAMEEHKLRYLQIFLTRFSLSLKDCVKLAREMEKSARNCYVVKTEYLTMDKFVNMLLVDGAFIISLLLGARRTSDDYYYHVFYSPQLLLQVTNDIILLENQLPFFVIERLFTKFVSHMVDHSLFELTFNLFQDVYFEADQKPKQIPSPICKHFTDFLRICLMPSQDPPSSGSFESIPNAEKPKQIPSPICKHFTDFLRMCLMPSEDPPSSGSFESIPNAEKLHDAGVTFKLSPSKCLVDIQFNAGAGELQIPRIKLGGSAESFYRNVMAFEMYHQGIPNPYLIYGMEFLDYLINTPNDVDLLVQEGIIYNGLGDNQAVTTLFNNLLQEIVVTTQPNRFGNLSKHLNAYYRVPTHKWQAIFKRDYFSTPWRAVSTFAAFILLLLTLLSTIWAIKS